LRRQLTAEDWGQQLRSQRNKLLRSFNHAVYRTLAVEQATDDLGMLAASDDACLLVRETRQRPKRL
jgi:predicted dinucleotide-binding enzyme